MKRIPYQLAYSLSICLLILVGSSARADLFSALAVDNATVQVEGRGRGTMERDFSTWREIRTAIAPSRRCRPVLPALEWPTSTAPAWESPVKSNLFAA